ncbi:MAG TPA: hypothetical protein VGI75_00315, partial [Pirellulales bacterium]
ILPDAVTPLVRLKANDLANLGNGAAVGSWSDSATGDSFNGSVSQSTAANRPTLLTNSLNGRAVVSFDGNDSLASPTTNSLPTSGNGITVIAVATHDQSGNAAQRLGQFGSHTGAAGKSVGFDVSGTLTSTSNGGAGFRFNNGASVYDTPVASDGFHIVTWQVANGQPYSNAKLYVDGTTAANTFTGSSTNTTDTSTFTGTDLELLLGTGRSTAGALLTSDYYTGELAEFLVFNQQLSIGQINLVANYLSTEYALPFAYETNVLFSASALIGDYTHDGVVDVADFVSWRNTGINGQQGYLDWRTHFGESTAGLAAGSQAAAASSLVPEPTSLSILIIGAAVLCFGGRGAKNTAHCHRNKTDD